VSWEIFFGVSILRWNELAANISRDHFSNRSLFFAKRRVLMNRVADWNSHRQPSKELPVDPLARGLLTLDLARLPRTQIFPPRQKPWREENQSGSSRCLTGRFRSRLRLGRRQFGTCLLQFIQHYRHVIGLAPGQERAFHRHGHGQRPRDDNARSAQPSRDIQSCSNIQELARTHTMKICPIFSSIRHLVKLLITHCLSEVGI